MCASKCNNCEFRSLCNILNLGGRDMICEVNSKIKSKGFIEYDRDDIADILQFSKFLLGYAHHPELPHSKQAQEFSQVAAVLVRSLEEPEQADVVDVVDALQAVMHRFNKHVCSMFSPPSWFLNTEAGTLILLESKLSPFESALAANLYEEYQRQYAAKLA